MTIHEAVAKFRERLERHPRRAEMLAAIERLKNTRNLASDLKNEGGISPESEPAPEAEASQDQVTA